MPEHTQAGMRKPRLLCQRSAAVLPVLLQSAGLVAGVCPQQAAAQPTCRSKRGLLRCCSLGRPLMGVPASRSASGAGHGEQGTLLSVRAGTAAPSRAEEASACPYGSNRVTQDGTCQCGTQQGRHAMRSIAAVSRPNAPNAAMGGLPSAAPVPVAAPLLAGLQHRWC